MSELGAFGLAPPPPAVPRPAASVVLWREGPGGPEVFLVRRAAGQRFAPGFTVFPGGRRDPEDAAVPVRGCPPAAAPDVACAARELFEEAGVLVATGGPAPGPAARDAARRALLDGRRGFGPLLAELGLAVDGARLVEAGRWVTPEHLPVRFDAVTYLLRAGAADAPSVWPGELADGGFLPARAALGEWERGERHLLPPNLWPVRVLARGAPPDLAAMRDPPRAGRRIEIQGGIVQLALRTPTLPPAAHTNTWLVDLGDATAVVDPGSPWPDEQARLDAILDELAAEGRPAREVWLTHGHADHVGGLGRLVARGLAVRAHRAIAPRLPGVLFKPLRDGELLGGRFGAVFTPGHAREHVAFEDERTGALLAGDMISTLSTIVVDPPEGEMAAYEGSLERLIALRPRAVYPAHGPPAVDGAGALRGYLAHRAEREALVVEALGRPGTLAELTARAYPEVAPAVLPVAERSCLAVLLKLQAGGRAAESGGIWRS